MLTGKKLVILGGDARQLEVIKKLNELDAQLSLVGFDQLDQNYNGTSKVELDEVDCAEVDSIILPTSGASDEGIIETIFSDKTVKITKEWLKRTPKHCTIYTGISTPYLSSIAKESNRDIVELFERDDVAIYNSVPTAEGVLMMVIQNTDITINQSKVVILGLGRIGMSFARTFQALGANVRVGARRPEHLARVSEMGMKPFYIRDLEQNVHDIDVCINTIPARVLDGEVLSNMPVNALIVDVASKPGGTDFRYAEKRGIKAILAPGLPGIVAPKTAGRIIANVLSELLQDKFQGGSR
ncbi:dipicolinate synthase subunit A [Scopulibacillus darangshiensis]|uniref:Dipicolinate synthase subunit A n=1 Tax=Scopulibacillus darangshiensis TaxID=442528 RepID=A0A4R2P634_9BACL|nr:dipicolinic acid synthetase subunit A [Scopulibacillus darangshiensis]TCP30283.1 dipicolinate synthase subunit A [Scopulibacillus darangshiensis]